jgi:hypothetical protein
MSPQLYILIPESTHSPKILQMIKDGNPSTWESDWFREFIADYSDLFHKWAIEDS